MHSPAIIPDVFTLDEQRALAPYFTNVDRPIFALTNLPETVKGALFARYSRSAKTLRRLFLDEFLNTVAGTAPAVPASIGTERAERLYDKVLADYGDDSVAQLGGAHIAVEGASNVLTKVLEWGRLMAYLEQSTRYVPYTDRPGGQWKYHVPLEVARSSEGAAFTSAMDHAFETYAVLIPRLEEHFRRKYPKSSTDSDGVYRTVIRAKALDTLRGLLPAATTSNVGLFGTGQAFEALLLRMDAHPLAEARDCARAMLAELRQVIPAFLTRVDHPDRGRRWSAYLARTRDAFRDAAAPYLAASGSAPDIDEVRLTDFDPAGEVKVVAAALYAVSDRPDLELMEVARRMPADERRRLLAAYAGDRANRRHKPGRAFERTSYRFDVLADYGAFRDLQRHRLLTLEWQPLTTRHGYVLPAAIEEVGALDEWRSVMDRSAELHERLMAGGLADAAPYAVAMAYRIRFYMEMNAREAMHVIELRTAPQGHPSYRRVCQQMHRAIADVAGHTAIAEAMRFADHSTVELERLQAERRLEQKRTARD